LSPQPAPDLFQESVVSAYVDAPRYLERSWLEQQVTDLLAQNDCRFLLLTAEPGSGKSAFMAGMARQHPSWPRYFIRRDQLSPFGNVGVRDFLLSAGLQMAACFPAAFQPQPLRVAIEQRLGDLEPGAEAVGAQVERLLASPFYQAVLEVHQQVQSAGGNLIGLRVGEWISDPHLIPISDLQAMALIDPGKVLLGQQPDLRLVFLVDALDELRYHPEGTQFLSWLASLPLLPANLSFLLTSRDDPALLSELRSRLGQNLIEMPLLSQPSQVQEELRRYAARLAQEPSWATLFAGKSQQQAFIERAVERSNGNIGFLDALGRALDSAMAQADEAGALRLLSLQTLPAGLNALHAHLLRQVWEVVHHERVEMRDLDSGETFYLNAWTALYLKILGVLAVAREPLTPDQILSLGGISALSDELPSALQRLTQFCDLVDNRYRLYHASLAEFITAESTRQNPATLDLYVDGNAWHSRIASFYWPSGDHTNGARLDAYGLNHLAFHLSQAGDHRLLQLPALPGCAGVSNQGAIPMLVSWPIWIWASNFRLPAFRAIRVGRNGPWLLVWVCCAAAWFLSLISFRQKSCCGRSSWDYGRGNACWMKLLASPCLRSASASFSFYWKAVCWMTRSRSVRASRSRPPGCFRTGLQPKHLCWIQSQLASSY
jgi:hypothetical protein